MTDGHLTGRNIFCVGMAQLINWGITFYMPGVFGTAILAETGWSPVVTFSGLTVAMLVMGLVTVPLKEKVAHRILERSDQLSDGSAGVTCNSSAAIEKLWWRALSSYARNALRWTEILI